MFCSVFDIFKVGVGPSSSHTYVYAVFLLILLLIFSNIFYVFFSMGPMLASLHFLKQLRAKPGEVTRQVKKFRGSLHGSLAFTGVGHHSDRATILGLLGHDPKTYDKISADKDLKTLEEKHIITQHEDFLQGAIDFNPKSDLVFDFDLGKCDLHPNGMKLIALDEHDNVLHEQVYYSIGGGFIQTEQEFMDSSNGKSEDKPVSVPYPFSTSDEMVKMSLESGMSIADMVWQNEISQQTKDEVEQGINEIWKTMDDCIFRGLNSEGILPGGLKVRRRAMKIHQELLEEKRRGILSPMASNEWLTTYAMAVNEENACGGQIVTAPTNGAAGVVPAALKYYLEHVSYIKYPGRNNALY